MHKIIYKNLLWLSLSILLLIIYQVLLISISFFQLFSQPFAHYFEGYLVSSFWFCALFLQRKAVNLVFRYSGDNLECDESALIISNHASWFDFLVMAHISNNYSMLEHLRFLAWRTIYSIPSLKMLVKTSVYTQNWTVSPKDLFSKPKFSALFQTPTWAVLFPEVDICTHSHKDQHSKFCEENGLPKLQYLLYPRFPAFVSTIQALSSKNESQYQYQTPSQPIQNMYCCTMTYDRRGGGNLVSLSDYLALLFPLDSGVKATLKVRVHINKFPIRKLPTRQRKLEKWLEKRWVKNDQILASMK